MNSSNKIELINKYIEDLHELSNSFNLHEEYVHLQNKVDSLMLCNVKLTEELNQLNKELQSKNDELSNLTKVSYIQSISKQLTEKDNYINQLENKLRKITELNDIQSEQHKSPKLETIEKPAEIKPIEEPIEKPIEEQTEEVIINDFNPDDFEDIEGYELIMYKKNYYLKNINKQTVYTIVDNNVGKKVGIINSTGKVKLNKN